MSDPSEVSCTARNLAAVDTIFIRFYPLLCVLLLQDLEFHGVMRFFFQDMSHRVATKCVRVSSTATTQQVVNALIERFRPDMKMLTATALSLFEVFSNGGW